MKQAFGPSDTRGAMTGLAVTMIIGLAATV